MIVINHCSESMHSPATPGGYKVVLVPGACCTACVFIFMTSQFIMQTHLHLPPVMLLIIIIIIYSHVIYFQPLVSVRGTTCTSLPPPPPPPQQHIRLPPIIIHSQQQQWHFDRKIPCAAFVGERYGFDSTRLCHVPSPTIYFISQLIMCLIILI